MWLQRKKKNRANLGSRTRKILSASKPYPHGKILSASKTCPCENPARIKFDSAPVRIETLSLRKFSPLRNPSPAIKILTHEHILLPLAALCKQITFCLALEYVLPHVLMVTRRANMLFACIYNLFSGMCSRKYNIRLGLENILEDVLLVNRAKTTAGPPSFAPLCSLDLWRHEPRKESLYPFYLWHPQGPWPLK